MALPKRFQVLLALAFGLALPGAVSAQDVKSGPYFGIQYGHNRIGGEFDDTIALIGPSDVIDVPRVAAGGGPGIVFGFRSSGGGGFELGWHRSKHRTSSSVLGSSNATFSAFDLDGKIGLTDTGPTRLWVLLGVGIVQLDVEGSRVTANGNFDARYKGASINLGLGGAYYVTPQLGLTLDVFWRQTRFSTVEGADIDGGLKGPGAAMRVATIWTF